MYTKLKERKDFVVMNKQSLINEVAKKIGLTKNVRHARYFRH